MQSFLTVERVSHNSQATEVVEQIVLNVVQSRLCLLHGIRFDAESQELSLCQTVVALRQLLSQHLTVLSTNLVEIVLTIRNADALFKALRIGTHIHKGQFKMNGAIEKVQEAAPLIEDRSLIFLLCQLIVDVLELNCFGVVVVIHSADPIGKHSLERNGLLCGLRYAIVFLSSIHNSLNLLLLCSGEICGHLYVSCLLFLLGKQSHLPPFQVAAVASGRRSSCSSCRDESLVE